MGLNPPSLNFVTTERTTTPLPRPWDPAHFFALITKWIYFSKPPQSSHHHETFLYLKSQTAAGSDVIGFWNYLCYFWWGKTGFVLILHHFWSEDYICPMASPPSKPKNEASLHRLARSLDVLFRRDVFESNGDDVVKHLSYINGLGLQNWLLVAAGRMVHGLEWFLVEQADPGSIPALP